MRADLDHRVRDAGRSAGVSSQSLRRLEIDLPGRDVVLVRRDAEAEIGIARAKGGDRRANVREKLPIGGTARRAP